MGKDHAAHLRSMLATARAQGLTDRVTSIKKHLAALKEEDAPAGPSTADEAPVGRTQRRRRDTDESAPKSAAD